jgi:hypothetical protein
MRPCRLEQCAIAGIPKDFGGEEDELSVAVVLRNGIGAPEVDELSASPMPSRPVSVRTRTSTESWLLAVFACTFGIRRIWQTTSVIFMGVTSNRLTRSRSEAEAQADVGWSTHSPAPSAAG